MGGLFGKDNCAILFFIILFLLLFASDGQYGVAGASTCCG
jgi:hypothetical protein